MAKEILIPLITSLILAIPGIWALIAQRRKSTADVADLYQQIAKRQAEENDKLEQCQDRLEGDLRKLRVEMTSLMLNFEQLKMDYAVLVEDYDALSGYVDELIELMKGAGIRSDKTKPVRRFRVGVPGGRKETGG